MPARPRAYLYLRAEDFSGALERTRRAIRICAALGNRSVITRPSRRVSCVDQQHCASAAGGGEWEAFERDNPELLRPGLLLEFYPKAQLESDLARRCSYCPAAHP